MISSKRNQCSGRPEFAQYDTYAEIFYDRPVPFQSIDEFLNITYDYVDTHGPFTEESYEKYTQLGEVDWDRLEW